MRGKGIIAATLAVLLVLVGGGIVVALTGGGIMRGGFGPDKTAIIDRTFDVTGAPTLALDNKNGSVTITRGDDAKIVVHAIKRAATDEMLQKMNVQLTQDGNRVTVHTDTPEYGGFVLFGPNNQGVEYHIQVPARADIGPARTANSSVSVSGIAGTLDLGTSNGPVTVRDFDGTVMVQTSNGSVHLTNGKGAVHLRTSNSSVEVANVQATTTDVHTTNGRITFAGSLAPNSDNQLETSNGSIVIRLPADSAFKLDLHTSNGSLDVAFPVVGPVQSGERSRHDLQGVVGRPDASLTAHTSNGSITLAKQEA